MEHLTNNNLLSRFQHGFIKARSCTTQLLAVLDDLTNAIVLQKSKRRHDRGVQVSSWSIQRRGSVTLADDNRVTRGHSRILKKERVVTRQRRNHFRHRTVNRWNSLTEEVVSAPSLNSFKAKLDELWRGYSYVQNDCFPVRTHRQDQLTGF